MGTSTDRLGLAALGRHDRDRQGVRRFGGEHDRLAIRRVARLGGPTLRRLRLATEQGGLLTLLTDDCGVAFLPDGTIVAADNRAGHFSRWLANRDGSTSRTD